MRFALGAVLVIALPACRDLEDEFAASEPSGSAGDGREGPTLVLPNGHPLDWTTDAPAVLLLEDEALQLVNQRRVSLGLDVLISQVTHRRVARGHSRHMRRDVHDFFAHENPEGLTPGERLQAAGVKWTRAAENIASGQLTAAEVFDDWVNSPGHREHIDDPGLRRTGLGYQPGAPAPDYPTYWTQVFTD